MTAKHTQGELHAGPESDDGVFGLLLQSGHAIGIAKTAKDVSRLALCWNMHDRLVSTLTALTSANALAGVRPLVAGWNGEGKPYFPSERHPPRLGATLPKTDCGAIYDLHDTLSKGRALLAEIDGAK